MGLGMLSVCTEAMPITVTPVLCSMPRHYRASGKLCIVLGGLERAVLLAMEGPKTLSPKPKKIGPFLCPNAKR